MRRWLTVPHWVVLSAQRFCNMNVNDCFKTVKNLSQACFYLMYTESAGETGALNESVRREMGVHRELLRLVKRQKLPNFGHAFLCRGLIRDLQKAPWSPPEAVPWPSPRCHRVDRSLVARSNAAHERSFEMEERDDEEDSHDRSRLRRWVSEWVSDTGFYKKYDTYA